MSRAGPIEVGSAWGGKTMNRQFVEVQRPQSFIIRPRYIRLQEPGGVLLHFYNSLHFIQESMDLIRRQKMTDFPRAKLLIDEKPLCRIDLWESFLVVVSMAPGIHALTVRNEPRYEKVLMDYPLDTREPGRYALRMHVAHLPGTYDYRVAWEELKRG
jgi:hypothetical protein